MSRAMRIDGDRMDRKVQSMPNSLIYREFRSAPSIARYNGSSGSTPIDSLTNPVAIGDGAR